LNTDELTLLNRHGEASEMMSQVVMQEYLDAPPSVAGRLLSGMVDKAAIVKARKATIKDALADWQDTWDKASK